MLLMVITVKNMSIHEKSKLDMSKMAKRQSQQSSSYQGSQEIRRCWIKKQRETKTWQKLYQY